MNVINLESFACADALARTLRFHVAARSCALSPAAFSKRVRHAEEQLGVTLFARTTRRVSVTPDGERVLPRIRALLDDAAHLRDAGAAPPVDLVIGTRHELGLSWLMPARAHIQKLLPRVTVHLRFGGSDHLEEALARLRIDAAVLSRLPATRRVSAFELAREDYVMVAARRLVRDVPFRNADDARHHVLVDADDTLPLYRYARQRPTAP